jgi:hypothetical protein
VHQIKLPKFPDFDASFSQLMDCTRSTGSDLETSDVHKIAERRIFSLESRQAIDVSNILTYGFGRMFESLRETGRENGIRVFRNLDEALDWILSKSMTV